jgi:hypothetical protein
MPGGLGVKQFVGYRRLPSAPGAPRGGPESSREKAVTNGCFAARCGTLTDTLAEVHTWIGAADPASAPAPPLPEYSAEEQLALPRHRFAPAKYLHSASWAALVKQVVSDAESDAIIAVVKRSQFLWFVAKVESGL